MYCIKCGVELADSETRCPLCGTPVFHPDLPRNLTDPPFPADRRIRREDVNRSGILFVLTVVALLPAILALLCDWRINGTIVWSGLGSSRGGSRRDSSVSRGRPRRPHSTARRPCLCAARGNSPSVRSARNSP